MESFSLQPEWRIAKKTGQEETTLDNDIHHMLAQNACRDLVLRAAAYADAGNAQALALLFAQDAVLLRPNAQPLEGRDAIFNAYVQRPTGRITRHLITNTLVEVDAPGEAHARSYVLLWSGTEADADGPAGRTAQARQMVGEFDDRFLCTPDGNWLIHRRDARFVLHRDS